MPSAKDPICGMTVDTERAAAQEQYNGQTYYFCSAGCAAKFRQDPAKYAS